MLSELAKQLVTQIETFFYLIAIINGVLHLIFATAVARDTGKLTRLGQKPILVSGATWAFATLIGGVFVASVYWFLHYSTLTRTLLKELN
jgi:hypothetical protein